MAGLGEGLDFLFGQNVSEESPDKTVRLSLIEPDRNQPRKNFSEEGIEALADSIREHGVLQPILVRPAGEDGMYIIIAGERRWRAARMLGLDEVPVIIKEVTEVQAMQIALIENLQREDLDPVEEAMGYKKLSDQYGMSQENIAKMLGKSRSSIANSMRILNLSDSIKELLSKHEISVGHAKALLSIEDEELREEIAAAAARGELTVRDVEKAAAKAASKNKEEVTEPKLSMGDPYPKEIELSLRDRLTRRVDVKPGKKEGSGTIVLEYYDRDDLSALAQKLSELGV